MMGRQPVSKALFPASMDYSFWFKDKTITDYFDAFPKSFPKAADSEKRALFIKAEQLVAMYSLLVYCLYNIKPEFKKAIDSNNELRSNFSSIKSWLDNFEGEKIADLHISELKNLTLGGRS